MNYQVIDRNDRHVQAIAKHLKHADASIWRPTRTARARRSPGTSSSSCGRKALNGKAVHRVVFHEITRRRSRKHRPAAQLSMDLVNAQQARRALDYLVGFNLSPLLWKKVRRGLSPGGAEPALRLIVERERRSSLRRPEYWTLEAESEKAGQAFSAKLTQFEGRKVEQFSFTDADAAHAARTRWSRRRWPAAGGEGREKQKRRNRRPFTTSPCSRSARKLGFTAQRTMRIAQQLYEGVDTGEGSSA